MCLNMRNIVNNTNYKSQWKEMVTDVIDIWKGRKNEEQD